VPDSTSSILQAGAGEAAIQFREGGFVGPNAERDFQDYMDEMMEEEGDVIMSSTRHHTALIQKHHVMMSLF